MGRKIQKSMKWRKTMNKSEIFQLLEKERERKKKGNKMLYHDTLDKNGKCNRSEKIQPFFFLFVLEHKK